MMTTSFKNVIEAYEVALNIDIWIGYAVANARLGCKVHNNGDFVLGEDFLHYILISNRSMNKRPVTI